MVPSMFILAMNSDSACFEPELKHFIYALWVALKLLPPTFLSVKGLLISSCPDQAALTVPLTFWSLT